MAIQRLHVGRNTALLSAALAANSATLQLSAAVASLTLVRVIDVDGLLGLGPAIVLASGALVALPAGRAMDRVGRVPMLAARLRRGRARRRAGRGRQRRGARAARAARPARGGRGERHGAAGPHRGGRHVPAGAARARHRARALRRRLRGDPRPGGVQPAAGRPRPRRRRAGRALARRPAASWSSPARSSCACGPTRAGSPAILAPRATGRTRRPRRCASCCAAPASSPRCSPPRPASR